MLTTVNTSNMDLSFRWLVPGWPAIPGVQALFTLRGGGHSAPPWNAMNLGDHVGDDVRAVQANRQLLARTITQRSARAVRPVFMQQVHGCGVQILDATSVQGQAFDACVTDTAGIACTIMVADCLPVLIAHQSGLVIGAAHAGWRGLAGVQGHGVLESLWQAYVEKLSDHGVVDNIAAHTQIWLGPCIGPEAFEVGDEVRQALVEGMPSASQCFIAQEQGGKWRADLAHIARLRWQEMGVMHIDGNDSSPAWCTVGNASQFFSHRRDAGLLGSTGRMAACIWKC